MELMRVAQPTNVVKLAIGHHLNVVNPGKIVPVTREENVRDGFFIAESGQGRVRKGW